MADTSETDLPDNWDRWRSDDELGTLQPVLARDGRFVAGTADGVPHRWTSGSRPVGGLQPPLERGVLFDLAIEGPLPPAYAVTSHDFERAEKRQGVTVGSGDALVVRLGWTGRGPHDAQSPGISMDAVRWMRRRGVALVAPDRGDAHPP